MILALTLVIGFILGRRTDAPWRRVRGFALAGVYLGMVTLVSIFFWPLWSGEQIAQLYWQLHMWLPGWR